MPRDDDRDRNTATEATSRDVCALGARCTARRRCFPLAVVVQPRAPIRRPRPPNIRLRHTRDDGDDDDSARPQAPSPLPSLPRASQARLLELNLEKDALDMEYDRLLPNGSKTMANRHRMADLEARAMASPSGRRCPSSSLPLRVGSASPSAPARDWKARISVSAARALSCAFHPWHGNAPQ